MGHEDQDRALMAIALGIVSGFTVVALSDWVSMVLSAAH